MRGWPLFLVMAGCLSGCGLPPPEVCHPGQQPSPAADVKNPIAGFHIYAHSHNDYWQAHPLTDALEHHFYSVEADVHYRSGQVIVSHLGVFSKGTLKDLYLDPLQARVNALGSVYGNGLPFVLVVELKEFSPQLQTTLEALLTRYPMLSVSTNTTFEQRPVTVIFTGIGAAEIDFGQRFPTRPARTDRWDIHLDDPPADDYWTDYSLQWTKYIQWNGHGAIPAEQHRRLACITENAHLLGRKVRFYDTPSTKAAWEEQLQTGVDFVNTDDLAGLDAYLEQR